MTNERGERDGSVAPLTPPDDGPGPRRRPTRIAVGGALLAIVLLVAAVVLWSGDPSEPPDRSASTTTTPSLTGDRALIEVAEDLVAAFNDHDHDRFLEVLDEDPTVLQWPSLLGPYEPDVTDPDWFEFVEVLAASVVLEECEPRRPAPLGEDLYDGLVDCEGAIESELGAALGARPIRGSFDFGVAGGNVESVFWNQDPGGSVVDQFQLWLHSYREAWSVHWLGGAGSEPRYGPAMAETILEAAGDFVAVDGGPAIPTGPGPSEVAGPAISADPDGSVVVVAVPPGTFRLFPAPSRFGAWELDADGNWRARPAPDGMFQTATVTADPVTHRILFVAVTGGDLQSLVVLEASADGWSDVTALALEPQTVGTVALTLSADVDADGRLLVVSDPPGIWLHDPEAGWIEGADPWADPTITGPLPCRSEPLPESISVAFDPTGGEFVVASGADLCLYRADTTTLQEVTSAAQRETLRALTHDPATGLLFAVRAGRLVTLRPEAGELRDRGPVPNGMLWRNVAITARPGQEDLVVFDGVMVWSYDPVRGVWETVEADVGR